MSTPLNVLIVEDNDDDAFLIVRTLQRGGLEPIWWRVDSQDALLEALRLRQWDVVLCDSVLPRVDVVRALSVAHGLQPDVPVVIVSGRRSEEMGDVLASDDISGVLSKDRLEDLPALIRGIIHAR